MKINTGEEDPILSSSMMIDYLPNNNNSIMLGLSNYFKIAELLLFGEGEGTFVWYLGATIKDKGFYWLW